MYNKIAVIKDDGEALSYQGLFNDCKKLYHKLFGVKRQNNYKREYIILISDNSYESILTYITCILYRIPILIIDEKENDDNKKKILTKYQGAKYIISFLSNAKCIIPANFKEIQYAIDEKKKIIIFKNYKKLYYVEKPSLALIMLTSGSTGNSKCVKISYNNLESNTKGIIFALGITQYDRVILNLPISHVYGLSVLNTHLFCGATVVISKYGISTKSFWNKILKYDITTLNGVPFTYELIYRLGIKNRLKSFRKLTVAGGDLPYSIKKEILKICQKENISFMIMYGQTEATARISAFDLCNYPDKINSVGKSLYNLKIKIENSEIVVSGDSISLGYTDGEEGFNSVCKSVNYLYTGDIGYIDKDGFLYITGRKKHIAKINGIRYNLDDVEKNISKNFGVFSYAIEYDNKIFICCRKKDYNILEREKKIISEKLGINEHIIALKSFNEIPVRTNNKVDYAALLNVVTGGDN